MTRRAPGPVAALCLLAAVAAAPGTDDLFISEYGEGSGNNKYVEIYNGTTNSIDLADYRLVLIFNGGAWTNGDGVVALSGILGVDDVYVVCHPSADQDVIDKADLQTGTVNMNGDDAIGLFRVEPGTTNLVDTIGEEGPDPGIAWAVAGVSAATKDHTLVRKGAVVDGATNWTASAGTDETNSQWIVHPQDTFTFLGSHNLSVSNIPPILGTDIGATNLTVTVNSRIEVAIGATENEGDTVTLGAVSLPAGATFPTVQGTSPLTNTFAWTPSAPGVVTAALAAYDKDGTNTLGLRIDVRAPYAGRVWINEFHYDNTSTDANEGVEIAGRAGTLLSNYRLVLYNGANGKMYNASNLWGTIDHETRGYGAVWFAYGPNGMQNGDTAGNADGIALVRTGGTTSTLELLSYEGAFLAADGPSLGWQSRAIGVVEGNDTPTGESLQRIGTGDDASDFGWSGPIPHSRGALNSGQQVFTTGSVLVVQ